MTNDSESSGAWFVGGRLIEEADPILGLPCSATALSSPQGLLPTPNVLPGREEAGVSGLRPELLHGCLNVLLSWVLLTPTHSRTEGRVREGPGLQSPNF